MLRDNGNAAYTIMRKSIKASHIPLRTDNNHTSIHTNPLHALYSLSKETMKYYLLKYQRFK